MNYSNCYPYYIEYNYNAINHSHCEMNQSGLIKYEPIHQNRLNDTNDRQKRQHGIEGFEYYVEIY